MMMEPFELIHYDGLAHHNIIKMKIFKHPLDDDDEEKTFLKRCHEKEYKSALECIIATKWKQAYIKYQFI